MDHVSSQHFDGDMDTAIPNGHAALGRCHILA